MFTEESSLILTANLREIQVSSADSNADTGHEYKGRVNLARNAENAPTTKLPTAFRKLIKRIQTIRFSLGVHLKNCNSK